MKISESPMEKVAAVIPAAGAGVRMGGGRVKQFLDLNGRPILCHTLEKFQNCEKVTGIFLVAPASDLEFCRVEIVDKYSFSKVLKIIPGGKIRQDSVRNGLEATGGEYELIVIHDGVRPLVEISLIERAILSARIDRAVITALPAMDTVKGVGREGIVSKTYKRNQVWLAQTPQVFRYEDIINAHRRAVREGWSGVTDDAYLIEKAGIPVKVIEGSEYNIKVTTPNDMAYASFLQSRINKK